MPRGRTLNNGAPSSPGTRRKSSSSGMAATPYLDYHLDLEARGRRVRNAIWFQDDLETLQELARLDLTTRSRPRKRPEGGASARARTHGKK